MIDGDERWGRNFYLSNVAGSIQTLLPYDGGLVVAGRITRVGDLEVGHIAMWNGGSWRAMGGGVSGAPVDLAEYRGSLYALSRILAGDSLADGIARWDGVRWETLDGLRSDVACFQGLGLAVFDTILVAAGRFGMPDSLTYLARYDGHQWLPWTSPGPVKAMRAANGQLFIACEVSPDSTRVPRNQVFRWDGTAWQDLGPSMNDRISILEAYEDQIIAGGAFTSVGGDPISHIASWDGTAWRPLGAGLDATPLDIDIFRGNMAVCGAFRHAGGRLARRIAQWDGTSWHELVGPSGEGISETPQALAVFDGNLVVGGHFTRAGGLPAQNLAVWSGERWSVPDFGLGIDGDVHCLLRYGGGIVVGGRFSSAGSAPARQVAFWNGTSWDSLGAGLGSNQDGTVGALAEFQGHLIAAGRFDRSGSVSLSNIASWDGSAWSPIGSGIGAWISVLLQYKDHLIVAGRFTQIDTAPARNIASWDGIAWHQLDSGTDGFITDLIVYNGDLIVSGQFSSAGGIPCHSLARWDGRAWHSLCSIPPCPGGGALAIYEGDLLVGDGAILHRWNGRTWTDFDGVFEGYGIGRDSEMTSIQVQGSDLFLGGNFQSVSGIPVGNIAWFSNGGWRAMGSGVDSRVSAMLLSDSLLFVGGAFQESGNAPSSHIASWNAPVGGTALDQVVPIRRYPSPFRDTVTFSYSLNERGTVLLRILDPSGRQVARFARNDLGPGAYFFTWDGRTDGGVQASSGVYVFRLETPDRLWSGKVLRVR